MRKRTGLTTLIDKIDALEPSRTDEGVTRELVEILRPLDQGARERVLNEVQGKLEEKAMASALVSVPTADAASLPSLTARRFRDRDREHFSRLADGQPSLNVGPLTPERRAVVERAYETLCQDDVSKRDAREAFAELTADERAMVAANLREEGAKLGPEKQGMVEEMIADLLMPHPALPRYDRVATALDEAIPSIGNPELRKKFEANRADLQGKIDTLDRALRTEAEPFLRFCASVRGYELSPEPGAAMMALGRIFVGEEESACTELAEMLDGIEGAAKSIGWERLAPNAKACFDYLKSCIDEEPLETSEVLAYNLHFARRWARVGFPVVEMGHRTAASLMFTHGSDAIEAPWPAFVVKIPDGLVVLGKDGVAWATVKRVLCLAPTAAAPVWNLRLDTRSSSGEFFGLRVPLKTLDGELTAPVDWSVMHASGDVGLKRAIEMVGHLVAGACMLATADQDIVKRPWSPKAKSERRRAPGVEPPAGTRFIVTKNVGIDLREQVHEYIAGKSRTGAKLTVQFVVRGHRRWQACGPRHSERKLIWINPFWKGPEEGRALVRGYELRDKSKEGEAEPSGDTDAARSV